MVTKKATILQAYNTAVKNIRSNYGPDGIFAGSSHFKNYWARDSFFASFGSLVLKDYNIVKQNLELFLSYTKKGLVPIRIGDKNIVLSFFGIHSKKLEPRYEQDKGSNVAGDSNSLLLKVFYEYYRQTKDKDFLNKHKSTLHSIVTWNIAQIDDFGLFKSGKYATWHDSVKKEGYTLYNNILLYESLICASNIFKDSSLKKFAEKLKQRINDKFWNGAYYDDWINRKHGFSYFVPFENHLAIIFGIADKLKIKKIAEYSKKINLGAILPSLTNYPLYPSKEVSTRLTLAGMGDYHNCSLSWLFVGLTEVLGVYLSGDKDYSKENFFKIALAINKYESVYECYEIKPTIKPLKRIFYSSEKNFSWSAGFFIWTYNAIKNKL